MKYEQFTHGKSCCEIIIFLSNSTIRENAVKPLNKKKWNYFSLICDGVLCQQQQNDEKRALLSKHAKT